ncbi:hypothetical protein CAEBREN_23372 [Caenorhabditis brenneri]|uniref:Lin-15A/B-like domain-containing protein n=1 Tax=Caenorhabditis brenneri TaxID=135651 RepID=G0N190_CAEBE|nr:hypothetical protein CAEBREN_23372 [Caenorhabditis brenneri]
MDEQQEPLEIKLEPEDEVPSEIKLEITEDVKEEPQFEPDDKMEAIFRIVINEELGDNSANGRRCHLCLRKVSCSVIKHVTMKHERVFLATFYLLQNKTSLEMARKFIDGSTKNVCRSHYPDAIDLIFQEIGVKDVKDLDESHPEKVIEVMKSLTPRINKEKFFTKFAEFIKRNRGKEERTPYGLPTRLSQHCSVCQLISWQQEMTPVVLEDSLIILALGTLLTGQKDLKEARCLIRAASIFSCQRHFTESLFAIFREFRNEGTLEINNLTKEQAQKVLFYAQKMCHGFTLERLKVALNDFSQRYTLFQEVVTHVPIVTPTRMRAVEFADLATSQLIDSASKKYCEICMSLVSTELCTQLTSPAHRMVLSVGMVLGKTMDIHTARWLSEKNSKEFCRIHLVQAVDTFEKFLGVERSEVQTCSYAKLQEVMIIVNALFPWCSIPEFRTILADFMF